MVWLNERYDEEVGLPERFSKMPWHWLETSKILLARAADDIADLTAQLKLLIQDLREIRLAKSRQGLKELNDSNIQLDGLSLMEIVEMRPFVLGVMGKLKHMSDLVQRTNEEAEDDGDDADED